MLSSLSSQVVDLTSPGVCTYSLSVSSTLNQSAKYAGKLMFDGRDDTCWSSDHGEGGQYIQLVFKERVVLREMAFMFQGGFVGQDATIYIGDTTVLSAMTALSRLELIRDSNDLQTFSVPAPESAISSGGAVQPEGFKVVRIAFDCSTDLYGRVTLYHLRLIGRVAGRVDC